MNQESNSKYNRKTSAIIIKEASFLKITDLTLERIGDKLILYGSIFNNSDSSFSFYNCLIPSIDSCEDVFSIITKNTLKSIKFTGKGKEVYSKIAPDDETGYVIPKSASEFYTIILPGNKIAFKVDLFKFYKFSSCSEKDFMLTYKALIPCVKKTKSPQQLIQLTIKQNQSIILYE